MSSTTLTWASSGNGTKTNTTNASLIDDIDTLVSSKSGDSTFSWQKAGKSNSSTPRWLLLSRKDGSAGRIGLIIWDSAPAANNAAILDGTPTSNALQIVWFPNGTGTTLSNLTAASGTICGNDTGVVKCCSAGTVPSIYNTGAFVFYFDSYDGLYFAFQTPGSSDGAFLGAGLLAVDNADVAYDATCGSVALNTFATQGWAWSASFPSAGSSNTGGMRTNYGTANRFFEAAFTPISSWGNQPISATDILSDTMANAFYFPPIPLLGVNLVGGGVVKGEGPVLKARQFAWGPGSVSAFTTYYMTGPVVGARQMCNRTLGGNMPWLLNFKV